MIRYTYILAFFLFFVAVKSYGWNTTQKPKWTTTKPCSKHCTEDRKTVCLYHEDVPQCYADCLKKRPKCPQKCECCECEHHKEDQVCGVDGQSYRNACAAKCNGVDVKCKGDCKCCCKDFEYHGAEVCSKQANDQWKKHTYKNACEARCQGEHIVLAPCPCECKTDENIVCGKDGKTYLNQCLAKCLGGLGDGKDDKHKDIQCKGACPCHKGGKWKMGAMGSSYGKHSHEKKHDKKESKESSSSSSSSESESEEGWKSHEVDYS